MALKEKINKGKLTIAVLLVLLVIVIGYIGIDKYQQAEQQKQISIFEQGAQYGYEQAITQIIQQVSNCQQVPLYYGNQTINIVAVECINQSK